MLVRLSRRRTDRTYFLLLLLAIGLTEWSWRRQRRSVGPKTFTRNH